MAITIDPSVFDKYNEALDLFKRTIRLIYPEKKEACPNCYLDTLGTRNRSISLYKAGGPYPFDRGMPCPYCGGKGYKAIEVTEDIESRIYWDRKYWANVNLTPHKDYDTPSVNLPDGAVQTIIEMTKLDEVNQCKYMIPLYDGIEKYDEARFQKAGPSFPQGFKQNATKYVVTFWTRVE